MPRGQNKLQVVVARQKSSRASKASSSKKNRRKQKRKGKGPSPGGFQPFPKEHDSQWIGATSAPRAQTRALVSFGRKTTVAPIIKTMEDLFHGALWSHLLNRHVIYPLPSIIQAENAAALADWYVKGEGTAVSSFNGAFRTAGGSDLYSLGLGPPTIANRVCSFRYMTSLGRVVATKKFNVTAGTSQEWWICFDPTQRMQPIHYLDVTNRATVASSPPTTWTTTPHLICTSYVLDGTYAPVNTGGSAAASSVGRRGEDQLNVNSRRDWDVVRDADAKPNLGGLPLAANIRYRCMDGMYWDGGAQLDVDVVNPSAYGTSAIRVVSRDNITHAYLTELRFIGSLLQNLPLTNGFVKSNAATAAHSGGEWDTTFEEDISTPAKQDLAALRAIDRALRRGKCVIQIVLAATAANVDFELNLSGNSWGATTHFDVTKAGALPYETVPYMMPIWFDVGRCSGVVKGATAADRMATIGLNALNGAASLMPSSTPLQISMSNTSPAAIKDVVRQIAPHVAELQPDSHVRDELKGAASALIGQKVLPYVGNVVKRGGTSLIKNIFSAIGRNLGRLAPVIEADAAEAAPLLIEAL